MRRCRTSTINYLLLVLTGWRGNLLQDRDQIKWIGRGPTSRCRSGVRRCAIYIWLVNWSGARPASVRHRRGDGVEVWCVFSLTSLVRRSEGEPAMNLYEAPGLFGAHKDHMALTVLVPLTSRSV